MLKVLHPTKTSKVDLEKLESFSTYPLYCNARIMSYSKCWNWRWILKFTSNFEPLFSFNLQLKKKLRPNFAFCVTFRLQAKRQLIWKGFFGVFNSSTKWTKKRKNNSIMIPKVELFLLGFFWGRIEGTKKSFWN